MMPSTVAMAASVNRLDASIIRRTLATAWAAAGFGSLMAEQDRNETVEVAEGQSGERLDRVLALGVAGLSRSRLKALVLAGRVAISGRTIRDPGHRVNAGEVIAVAVPPPEP